MPRSMDFAQFQHDGFVILKGDLLAAIQEARAKAAASRLPQR